MTDEAADWIAVDMMKCAGHGICGWLFPDRIGLDDWGYAWVDPTPIGSGRQRRAANAAVRACPRRALMLLPTGAAATNVS